MVNFNITKKYWYTLIVISFIEVLSLAGWSWPLLGKISFWVIIGLIGIISFWRLDIALWIVLSELVIGSKGYLFSINLGSYAVSIRLGIFCVVMAVWLIKRFSERRAYFIKSRLFRWFILFIVALGWGIGNGLIHHHPLNNIFLDANGFLYFGLIFVFYDVIIDSKKIKKAFEIMLAGVTAVALKTIILMILFASRVDFLQSLYRWVRDTRVYEITLDKYNFYRVFSQSQIFSLLIAVIMLTILTIASRPEGIKKYYNALAIYILTTTTILISYSRSIWLSFAVMVIIISFLMIRNYRYRLKNIVIFWAMLIGIFIVEIAFVLFLVNVPNWIKVRGGGVSLSSLVEERLANTNEAALQSRWNLLKPLTKKIESSPILGQGFGSEVTYVSKDPRIVASTGGIYKTYSFEWGYLDLALKLGLIGFIIYGILIYKIIKNGYVAYKNNLNDEKIMIISLMLALISLLITHATTPYLNHPLGIGFLIFTAVVFEVYRNGHNQNKKQPAEN